MNSGRILRFQRRFAHRPAICYDFRSDTVTRPTPAMFEAMLKASTDDDVMQTDASTRQLESFVAELSGHEDALFCVSGTMTNQLALRCWLRGALQSVLLDERSHIHRYENAGIAFHTQAGTVTVRPRPGESHLTLQRIRPYIMEEDVHCAATRVISLENTLNGSIFPLDEIRRIGNFCRQQDLILHLDGARLWNASVETCIPLSEWCKPFHTVSLCLSKGIGAPIGSMVVGPKAIIKQARHYRKLFGGGWRQSGPLAAAAMVGIQSVFLPSPHLDGQSQMKVDHENAKWFATTLPERVKNMRIVNKVETNMVFVDVRHAIQGLTVEKWVQACEQLNKEQERKGIQESVRIASFGYAYDSPDKDLSVEDHAYVLRLVFHHQTPRRGCELLIQTFEEVLHRLSRNTIE